MVVNKSSENMLTHALLSFLFCRPELFCKKGVLEYLTKFTGKHLRHSLFFKKKRLCYSCFLVNFFKHSRTPSFMEDIWWLLLAMVSFRSVLVFWNFFCSCFTSNKYYFSKLMLLNFWCQKYLFSVNTFFYWWVTYAMKFRY